MAGNVEIMVVTGTSAGDIFRFDAGSKITIGRDPTSDLVLQDPLVSRKHAIIECRSDGFFIEDLGSTHGTVHMGFKVEPGPKGVRSLTPGDEFKIGGAIFRIVFDASLAQAKKKQESTEKTSAEIKNNPPKQKLFANIPKGKKLTLCGGVGALALLLVLFVVLPEEKQGLPKQESQIPLSLPQQRVVGYFVGGKTDKERDRRHLDKAQFHLPAADLIVEYDHQSSVPLEVFIDETFIERIEPHPGQWQLREVIIRDVLVGRERKLIFDNVEFPPPQGKAQGSHRSWAIRNIRALPFFRTIDSKLDTKLTAVASLAERVDSSPDGLFLLLRAAQEAVIEALAELNREAVEFPISLEFSLADSAFVKDRVESIQEERRQQITEETSQRHLDVLVDLVARIEAELWKRVYSRLNRAELAARAKNHIEAHDTLMSVKAMFPDETDHRWQLAQKMFRNKKIVPQMVRERPERFRKNR